VAASRGESPGVESGLLEEQAAPARRRSAARLPIAGRNMRCISGVSRE
jgi:hypothetical protein